ncbi:MAG: thioredoxin domain-containing protein [Phycisphaerales bacterium]|nr:DUF255 domain-containing protein [Planctomycetota bacterium]MCH8508429.1 thioredoxin domain-containing protein [Phycisphaerales bacterium]
MNERTNRLALESSPYLLQHAHNPVDWRPWGDEAFAEARRRGVPLLVSVGYSTCYWCHVMERESFEDPGTAAVMNERFVCVKVDREERPDVDELTMGATVTFTGRGGWPTTVFFEPEGLRPYFAGTYFPRDERHGLPSFTRVLTAMSEAWHEQRAEVIEQAERLAGAVAEQLNGADEPVALGPRHAGKAVETLLQIFDRADGGFGGAPKFPQPVFAELLLDVRDRADGPTRDAVDQAVRVTLDKMAAGGLHDHAGGGFHRYSVDRHWTVPHFEKMLYDNAQLAHLYARAAGLYADSWYARVAERTCGYVLREMTDAQGGFHAAQDAEVDRREGLNYLWTPDEIDAVLDADDAAFARRVYGLDHSANFKDPHHPDEPARWVLRMEGRPEAVAERLGMEPDAFLARLDGINARLLAERDGRDQPGTDDKVLAAWNGLMIAGLARTAATLGPERGRRFREAAERAARFVLGSMRSPEGGLYRSWRQGNAKIHAPLEDHAFLIHGLLMLAKHADDPAWLDGARALAAHAERVFGDGQGGYFDTAADRSDLFVRARTTHDGATPSAGGVMLQNLLDLHEHTGDDAWLDRAIGLLRSLSAAVDRAPVGTLNPVRALLRLMSMGEALGGRYAFDTADPEPTRPERKAPVTVLANTDSVEVTPDTPGVFKVALEIGPGWHIVAAEPGETDMPLQPLRVGLTRGSGVAVYADYPAGEPHGVEGVGEILVHHGRIEFDVVLEHKPGVGASPGTPVLGVSYQACTDTECAPVHTTELEIGVVLKG